MRVPQVLVLLATLEDEIGTGKDQRLVLKDQLPVAALVFGDVRQRLGTDTVVVLERGGQLAQELGHGQAGDRRDGDAESRYVEGEKDD